MILIGRFRFRIVRTSDNVHIDTSYPLGMFMCDNPPNISASGSQFSESDDDLTIMCVVNLCGAVESYLHTFRAVYWAATADSPL